MPELDAGVRLILWAVTGKNEIGCPQWSSARYVEVIHTAHEIVKTELWCAHICIRVDEHNPVVTLRNFCGHLCANVILSCNSLNNLGQ